MVAPIQQRNLLIALLVAVTFFMENLDATVIATALPHMADTFNKTAIDLNIGMSIYMLVLAVFIPISGWVADRFGAKLVFSLAIAVFTLASVFCGMATTLEQFIAARILQGIGGAMMVPVGRLVVLRSTEKKDLVKAIAYITWPGLVAPVLGPPIGGFIVTYFTWPWIFYLNVPLGILCIVAVYYLIPAHLQNSPEQQKPFDLIGFLLLGGACFTFMYGVELIGQSLQDYMIASEFIIGGIILTCLSIFYMKKATNPLIKLDVLKIPSFAISIYGGSLFRISISTIPFLLPLMFQQAFGLNAFTSGLLVLAVFAGNLMMKPFTTQMMQVFGFKRILIINGIIGALAIASCSLLTAETPWLMVITLLFLGGLSRSMQFTTYNTIGFCEVPQPQMKDASTVFSIAFQIGSAMGIAIGALALRGAMTIHQNSHATTDDFQLAFLLVSLLAILAILDSFTLKPHTGKEILLKSGK